MIPLSQRQRVAEGRVRASAHLPLLVLVLLSIAHDVSNAGTPSREPSPERGYEFLRTSPLLPPDFNEAVFSDLWKNWPEPRRSEAENATPDERREMTFEYYGLMRDPDDGAAPAIGYVDDGKAGWVMNCLACHAGKVNGQVVPGLPNTHFDLQSLVEDVRFTKLALHVPFSHLDLGSMSMPLSASRGTTNSVMFGVVLGALRKPDMSVDRERPVPKLMHHDMDAPPLWNVKKKSSLYVDGFSPKNHRVLMQFMLLPENGKDTVIGWEEDFRDVLAWIESLEPPAYPFEIDRDLAANGEKIFGENCSSCHGTYGPNGRYEQQTIAMGDIGTDPVRFESLNNGRREWLRDSWMSHYGEDEVVIEPAGYVAPPLDGIWATAPYLHNGSVPTLWHLMHSDQRPVVWKRSEAGYDQERVGLEVTTGPRVPKSAHTPAEKRTYFDTRQSGKSAAGHTFPDVLTEEEKRAVLEYLKTL